MNKRWLRRTSKLVYLVDDPAHIYAHVCPIHVEARILDDDALASTGGFVRHHILRRRVDLLEVHSGAVERRRAQRGEHSLELDELVLVAGVQAQRRR
eukprot:SAG31_NODE_9109_length_1334_cov_1.030794_1_plen_97_part_00